jgi:adenylate cyclase
MSEIFISYARSTEAQAATIARALREQGFEVWRDDDLPPHRAYAQVIEERLANAKAVVVVWSDEAVKSHWVQSEADRARNDGKLVQLRLDGCALPMPFDRIQCADLTGWDGGHDHPILRKVIASVADLIGDAGDEAAPNAHPLPLLPSRLSIAVMPFANLSADPEQAYFTEGMVEEIVAALARFRSVYVVAAGASVVLKGKVASPHEAARQLGVSYLVEGSVRKAGDRVRINVHMVDAGNEAEIWSDRFEGTLDDVFSLQDRVAEQIAGVMEVTLQDRDIEKASARTTNISSYDLYLRAIVAFRLSRKTDMLLAIDLLEKAVALDPTFAVAISQSAICHRQVVDHEWIDPTEPFRLRGLELAERALRAAPDDPRVLAQVAASLPGLEGRVDRALALAGRATALNPASAFVWLVSGSVHLRCGDPDAAAEALEKSIRLDPISSANAFARMYLASARFQQQRFEEALALYRTTTLRLPVSYAVLASLHGHMGELDQGREALNALDRLQAGGVEKFARIWFPNPAKRDLLLSGIARLSEPTTA